MKTQWKWRWDRGSDNANFNFSLMDLFNAKTNGASVQQAMAIMFRSNRSNIIPFCSMYLNMLNTNCAEYHVAMISGYFLIEQGPRLIECPWYNIVTRRCRITEKLYKQTQHFFLFRRTGEFNELTVNVISSLHYKPMFNLSIHVLILLNVFHTNV